MNDAMPTTYSYYKAYSSVKRPFNKKTANYNRYFNKRVNTVKSTRVNTGRPKAEVNTVKASASWVWKPKHEELDHVFKSNSASKTLTRYDYVDALGRSDDGRVKIEGYKIRLSLSRNDIQKKDEKSSTNGQNQARSGKAWKSQSQIEAKVDKSQSQPRQSQQSKPEPTPKNT
ncbi:hypothetical protein Tco_1386500 [Tanacetum coccineum]